jgi:hypothetical protein
MGVTPNALKSARQGPAAPPSSGATFAATSTRSAISRAMGHEGRYTSCGASRVHKPHLDEMHGPESLPYRPGRASPRNPSPDDTGPSSESKIFQPTDSRQSGPEFGPAPRSTGGAPGHRGGTTGASNSGKFDYAGISDSPSTNRGLLTLAACKRSLMGERDGSLSYALRLESWIPWE